jgi:hypothetical protein
MEPKKTKTAKKKLDELSKALSDRPELADRLLSIVKLADEPTRTGRIRSADEVEELLIEEVRKLGNQTLANWAQGVDTQLGEELKSGPQKVRMREKKR